MMNIFDTIDALERKGLLKNHYDELHGDDPTAEADMNSVRFFFFVKDKQKIYRELKGTGYETAFYALVANREGTGRQKHAYFRSGLHAPKGQRTVALKDY